MTTHPWNILRRLPKQPQAVFRFFKAPLKCKITLQASLFCLAKRSGWSRNEQDHFIPLHPWNKGKENARSQVWLAGYVPSGTQNRLVQSPGGRATRGGCQDPRWRHPVVSSASSCGATPLPYAVASRPITERKGGSKPAPARNMVTAERGRAQGVLWAWSVLETMFPFKPRALVPICDKKWMLKARRAPCFGFQFEAESIGARWSWIQATDCGGGQQLSPSPQCPQYPPMSTWPELSTCTASAE